jgi:hypothetical protein
MRSITVILDNFKSCAEPRKNILGINPGKISALSNFRCQPHELLLGLGTAHIGHSSAAPPVVDW